MTHGDEDGGTALAAAVREHNQPLLGFGVLSAIAGAVLAIVAHGAGVPIAYLANSPFSSYLVPGLILGLIVGGTQLAAAVALWTKRRTGLLLSAVAGFGMIIWIFVELAIIGKYSWLQTIYFSLGVTELIGVFALLGIGPALIIPWLGSAERGTVPSSVSNRI